MRMREMRVGPLAVAIFAPIVMSAPASAAVVMLNQVVTNNTGFTQSYTFTDTTFATIATPTLMDGSFTGTLTDNSIFGATAADVFYTAFIDQQVVFTMGVAGYSVGPGLSMPWAPMSFSQIPGPPVVSEISVEIRFTLTPGASASFTSIFNANPSPSGLMLLGCAALVTRRRRA